MARVLCAWEYGGELGHVQRLTALAGALRDAGHDPALALSNLHHAGATSRGLRCYQAPLTAGVERPTPAPASLPHVLLEVGFHDTGSLEAPVRAWLRLFDLERPDVIAADYAPAALLAARVAGIPAATVGSGFSSPPKARPLPRLRSWEPMPEAQLSAYDDAATATANHALRALGAAPIESAWQLFEARDDILCTFAELDPFGPRDAAEYLGPIDEAMPGTSVAWPSEDRPRVFAYLKRHYPTFNAVLDALAASEAQVIVAVPGLSPWEAERLCTPRMKVYPRALTLAPLLAECDACIGHAGLGLTSKALVAGVPMGLLPTHLEQLLIARRVEALGVATYLRPSRPGEPIADYAGWLRELCGDEARRQAARKLRSQFEGYSPGTSARRAAERVVAVAAARSK